MTKDKIPFLVRDFHFRFPDLNTGGMVEIDGVTHKVVAIQSIKILKGGVIEVKGWCKEIRQKEDDNAGI